MLIGYARTSTLDQVAGYEAQQSDLQAAGCEKVFGEQISSIADRKKTWPTRFSHDQAHPISMSGLDPVGLFLSATGSGTAHPRTSPLRVRFSLMDARPPQSFHGGEAKGASLRILGMNLDTTTATGKLMLNGLTDRFGCLPF